MYLIDLSIFVFFTFQKLSRFLGSKAEAGMLAEIKDIQADIFLRFLQVWQFHNDFIITTNFTDCTAFLIKKAGW